MKLRITATDLFYLGSIGFSGWLVWSAMKPAKEDIVEAEVVEPEPVISEPEEIKEPEKVDPEEDAVRRYIDYAQLYAMDKSEQKPVSIGTDPEDLKFWAEEADDHIYELLFEDITDASADEYTKEFKVAKRSEVEALLIAKGIDSEEIPVALEVLERRDDPLYLVDYNYDHMVVISLDPSESDG